jgi:hypothetical protein
MEAADEIPRQLRLRDLGGVIICDFIDLRFERHRRDLEKKLHENFKNDRAKTKVLRMSQFGIIEMTRQRMRPEPQARRSISIARIAKAPGLGQNPREHEPGRHARTSGRHRPIGRSTAARTAGTFART